MRPLNAVSFRFIFLIQGVYYLITALWALVDINSYMEVTGPKADIWLVKSMSLTLIPIALCLLASLYRYSNPVILLSVTSAAGLVIIDIYYAFSGVIARIYLLDAAMEIIFLSAWLILLVSYLSKSATLRKQNRTESAV